MTERQKRLIDAEIARHIALAKICDKALKDYHIEVAEALLEVLRGSDENGKQS
mgnify:CR=1 FL=1